MIKINSWGFVGVLLFLYSGYARADVPYVIDNFEDLTRAQSRWVCEAPIRMSIKSPPRLGRDALSLTQQLPGRSMILEGTADSSHFGYVKSRLDSIPPGMTHLRLMIFGRPNLKTNLKLLFFSLQEPRQVYSYTVYVSWVGWHTVLIPLNKFKDPRGNGLKSRITSMRFFEAEVRSDNKMGPVYTALDNITLVGLPITGR